MICETSRMGLLSNCCQDCPAWPIELEESQVAYARKSGWLWRFARSHRKWVKRWAVFDSKTLSFLFLKSPSQKSEVGKHNCSREIRAVTSGKAHVLSGGKKTHSFNVVMANGKLTSICCDSSAERDTWVELISESVISQVTLEERYEIHWHQHVGSGAYANVVLATRRRTGEEVAVKMVTSAACRKHFDMMDKEVQIMSMIDNYPYLLSCQEAFYSENHIFIISEYLSGGDLCSWPELCMGKMSGTLLEDKARSIFRQLLSALERLHELGVAHCDIKPENILFSTREHDAHVKLTDYNSASFCDENSEPGGTPEYMAPELITLDECSPSKEGEMGNDWRSGDMWSMGILLYWMLCGQTPFGAASIPEVMLNVQTARFEWPPYVELSEEVKDLIFSLLQKNPNLRPSCQEALQHNWTRSETALKPLLTIMADTRAILPTLVMGGEEVEPVCSKLDSATIAAMSATKPSLLSVKVPRQRMEISYGFAASMNSVIESEVLGASMESSGLEVADSLLSMECTSPQDTEIISPGSRDPMDSCMSVHRDLSFRQNSPEKTKNLQPLPEINLPRADEVGDQMKNQETE